MHKITEHIINPESTVREALQRLNEMQEVMLLFVVNERQQLVGTVTDGDIRRGLLKGLDLKDQVRACMHKDFRFLQRDNYDIRAIDIFREKKISMVPVLDDDKRIIRFINFNEKRSALPVDVVIMAGGRGERLKPLTDDLPKPLLNVGKKAILEHNLDRLVSYGVGSVYITVKYLAEKIIAKFQSYDLDNGEQIRFIKEESPLGTIGSVSLITDFSHKYVMVMNSDLLTDIDFEDFFRNFIEEEADMSVAAVSYKVMIPYAVLEHSNNKIVSFKEKPTYTYYSNGGIYLIRRELLNTIPVGKEFNATDFMEALIHNGKKVIQYPILGYWLDIGKHEDYKKAQEDIRHIRL